MHTRRRAGPTFATLLTATLLLPAPALAQALAGRVLDGDSFVPIPGAIVTLTDADGDILLTTVTDADGAFALDEPEPPAGSYRLMVDRVGYGRADAAIAFEAGRTVDVDVLLTTTAIPLDPVVVTEKRRPRLADVGFEQRRGRGIGIFIDRTEIEERSPTRITDLFRGRSGLRVITIGDNEDVRVPAGGRRLDAADCQPTVWIDGSKVRGGGPPEVGTASTGSRFAIDLTLTQMVDPHDVEGIEVYTGMAGLPVRFRTQDADCGTLLVWTRR